MTAAAPWRNRIVGSGEEAPEQLLANPLNWRVHPGDQRDALRGSLSTVGWVQQVLVNQTTGHVVDGHARIEEAITRGEAKVPVLYVDLSEEEEAQVLATLDPITGMAIRDEAKLEELLGLISVDDEGLRKLLGTLAGENPVTGQTDPDDIPEPGEAPYVQRGEVYQLGPHRVMCGDATVGDDVTRLWGAEGPCDLLWTDPPYGVDYEGKTKDRLRLKNDGWTGLASLLAGAFLCADKRMKPGAPFYVCHPDTNRHEFDKAIEEAGWSIRQTLIWVKNTMVLGHSDYQYQHEPMFYGYKPVEAGRLGRGKGSRGWYGDHSQVSVFQIDRPSSSPEHPTAKPVALVDAHLVNSSQAGDLVYDPFLGSGTTMISAQGLGRVCFGMEIDARYAQVAIERWQRFTGQTASRLDG